MAVATRELPVATSHDEPLMSVRDLRTYFPVSGGPVLVLQRRIMRQGVKAHAHAAGAGVA